MYLTKFKAQHIQSMPIQIAANQLYAAFNNHIIVAIMLLLQLCYFGNQRLIP